MRRRFIKTLSIGLLVGGCVAHTTTPRPTRSPTLSTPESASSDSVFSYDRTEIPFMNALLDDEESAHYRVRHIRFPSIGANRQPDNLVTGKYYESKQAGRKPLVIVLPIWGGHVYPPEKMTAYLLRHGSGGVNVFHMLGEINLTDWPALREAEDEESFMELWRLVAQHQRNTIIDIRRTIDWAEDRQELDSSRIGMIGFSRSAMMAALVAANDTRLAASVMVMGGAHPHLALANCAMLRAEGTQAKVQSEFGWTLEEFADRLEPLYRDLDPASYPGKADPERLLIIEAAKDRCIPPEAREALFRAMGSPERVTIPHGHKRSFLSMTPLGFYWLRHRIWSFLEEKL